MHEHACTRTQNGWSDCNVNDTKLETLHVHTIVAVMQTRYYNSKWAKQRSKYEIQKTTKYQLTSYLTTWYFWSALNSSSRLVSPSCRLNARLVTFCVMTINGPKTQRTIYPTSGRDITNAVSHRAGHETPHLKWHPQTHCCVHTKTPPVPLLTLLNPHQILTPHLIKIHFNTLPPTRGLFFPNFLNKILLAFLMSSTVCPKLFKWYKKDICNHFYLRWWLWHLHAITERKRQHVCKKERTLCHRGKEYAPAIPSNFRHWQLTTIC